MSTRWFLSVVAIIALWALVASFVKKFDAKIAKPRLLIAAPYREYVKGVFEAELGGDNSDLLTSMLIGGEHLSNNLKKLLIDSGLVHIAVVSGYNINVLASLVSSGTKTLFKSKDTLCRIISLISVVSYVWIVGAEVPVMRAFVMWFLMFLAKWYGRETSSLYVCLLSFLLFLATDLSLINDISFQLSYGATSGLIILENRFSKLFLQSIKSLNCNLLISKIFFGSSLSSTLAASIMVMPLLSFHFGRVSLVAVAVNTMVLWTVPLLMCFGALLLPLHFLSPLVSTLTSDLIRFMLDYIIFVSEVFSKLSFSNIDLRVDGIFLVLYYALILILCIPHKNL